MTSKIFAQQPMFLFLGILHTIPTPILIHFDNKDMFWDKAQKKYILVFAYFH